MAYGTVIRMKNKDSFITQAMLSSYLSVTSQDYLELLKPFVLKCMPESEGVAIDIEKLQQDLNEKYQLEILCNVVEKILRRLCKQKKGAYVVKKNGEFFVNGNYNSRQFDERQAKIRESIEKVIDAFQSFLHEKKHKSVSSETAREYISIFFDTYNYSIYSDLDRAKEITLNDNGESNYYVAQFILCEHEKDSLVFDYINEMIKGTLVAKSIYFFMNATNDINHKQIIRDTAFYLDTRLLIEVLGLNLEQEEKAMRELLSIVIENGGRLYTFSHYIDELKGIIYRYIKSPESRLALSLARFVKESYSVADAEAYMKTIDLRLNELGIDIVDKPSYEDNIKKQNWHIDYTELKKVLSANIDYSKRDNVDYSDALLRDADTIEAIAYWRGPHKPCSVFDCKAIFVTQNGDIARAIYKSYQKERFCKGEINFVITDVDLTAMMWLRTFGSKNEQDSLPKLKLLENAYAACKPTNAVMNRFLTKVQGLADSEKISQETAILLRSQYGLYDDISELTDNNADKIDDRLIKEMEARVRNRAVKAVKTELNEDYLELAEQREEAERERSEIENTRVKLIDEKKKIAKAKQDLDFLSKRQQQQREKIKVDRMQNEQNLQNIRKFRNNIVKEAKKKAGKKASVVRTVLYIAMGMVALVLLAFFAYSTYVVSVKNEIDFIQAAWLIAIVSVISLILEVLSMVKIFAGKIKKWTSYIYDKKYSEIMEQHKQFFE